MIKTEEDISSRKLSRQQPVRKRRTGRSPTGGAELPAVLWGILGTFVVLALFSPNPGIGLLGVAVAAGVSLLLWRPGEPQALLFIVGFQWLQGFAPVLLGLYRGEPIAALMGGAEFETSTVLTLLGIGAFALGLKAATRRAAPFEQGTLIAGLKQLNRRRLLMAWLILSVASTALAVVGTAIPALRQGLIAVEIWKWAAVLLLFFRWLASGRGGMAAILVLAVEAAVGMMGYFSAFKEVFFIVLLAGTGVFAIGRKKTGSLIAIGVVLLLFLGYWQAVKVPYRDFLSKGERAQVVRVSVPERITWLSDALFEVEGEDLSEGLEEGLRRLGYVEFFGHSIRSVPASIPHTNGKLWKEAILHPLMPRLIFPNKPAINDSDRTNAYTGVLVAGAEQGTSISIGYFGETYIDFGRWGMFPIIFLWGCLVGGCFQFIRRIAPHPLLGTAVASCLLLSTVLLLESSNIKMTGSLMAGFLVTAVLMHFFGMAAWRWLTVVSAGGKRRSRSIRSSHPTRPDALQQASSLSSRAAGDKWAGARRPSPNDL